MIPASKLNFAAWTGLGITALFGGTGIYLVRNSENSWRGEEKKELFTFQKQSESGSLQEEQVTSNPNLSPESKSLADKSDPGETDPSPEEQQVQEQQKQEASLSQPDTLHAKDNHEQDSDLEKGTSQVPTAEESDLEPDSQETEDLEEVEQKREDKNSDMLNLELDDDQDLQLPS